MRTVVNHGYFGTTHDLIHESGDAVLITYKRPNVKLKSNHVLIKLEIMS